MQMSKIPLSPESFKLIYSEKLLHMSIFPRVDAQCRTVSNLAGQKSIVQNKHLLKTKCVQWFLDYITGHFNHARNYLALLHDAFLFVYITL